MPAAAVAAALTMTGCAVGGISSGGHAKSPPRRIVPGGNHLALTIGAPRSTEGPLLAQIYAQALTAAGYRARVVAGLDRADAWPAVVRGSWADFRARLGAHGLVALPPAGTQLGLGVAMGRAKADALGATTVTQLLGSRRRIRVAAPRGCGRNAGCLPALRRVYGLRRVQEVRPDLVQDALRGGLADAAIVPLSDPHLTRDGERLLDDDRRALPGHSLTLVVRAGVARAAGPDLETTAAAAGSRLAYPVLAELLARVGFDELPATTVARQYLRGTGLVRGRRGGVR
jgi:osmoprotectant transport system substrate-binding protein